MPRVRGNERNKMGSFSIWHWLIVLAVVLLLFGRGKIPELMGDVAKGIKNFKQGMSDEDAKDEARLTKPSTTSRKPPSPDLTDKACCVWQSTRSIFCHLLVRFSAERRDARANCAGYREYVRHRLV